MRIPLLLAGNPKVSDPPMVRLDKGRWKIIEENIVDSILSFPIGYEVDGPTDITFAFIKRGTEKSISVFAQRI